MAADVLTRRQLGRTLLLRQHLLAPTADPWLDVVERLVGLQAQEPRDPYLALWSRIERFDPLVLEQGLLDRAVVRLVAMRGTIHLLSAEDALGLRGLFQPVLDGEMARHSQHKDALAGLDLRPVTKAARALLREPHTVPQLKAALAERFPDHDAAALALACRNTVALVQVPPRGLWTRSGTVTYVTAQEWLGRPVDPRPSLGRLVLRYLAAFGPATVGDLRTYTRLTGLREVVEGLRPELRTWRDEAGRELFDVPEGALADGDEPAPVRFLPEYDNVLLSHEDRSLVLPEGIGALYDRDRHGIGSVLVDGLVQATWCLDTAGAHPTVRILHRASMAKRWRTAIAKEAARALPILGRGDAGADIELIEAST